jgi:RNA polymerase sigma-70 factor (ECF subfamily)
VKDSGVQSDGASEGWTSLTLLDRIRQRDQQAWERLVGLYSPLVYHWCRQAGLQPADAEEVGQEVFLAVARGIATFHHDRAGDTFRGWLRTITRNKVLDHRTPPGGKGAGGSDAQQRLQRLPSAEPATENDADSEHAEKAILYRRAVELIESSFEPSTRRAFWLVMSGRKAKDVAAELGLSATAVYVAKSRVLHRLREEFAGLLDWPAPQPAEGVG